MVVVEGAESTREVAVAVAVAYEGGLDRVSLKGVRITYFVRSNHSPPGS